MIYSLKTNNESPDSLFHLEFQIRIQRLISRRMRVLKNWVIHKSELWFRVARHKSNLLYCIGYTTSLVYKGQFLGKYCKLQVRKRSIILVKSLKPFILQGSIPRNLIQMSSSKESQQWYNHLLHHCWLSFELLTRDLVTLNTLSISHSPRSFAAGPIRNAKIWNLYFL